MARPRQYFPHFIANFRGPRTVRPLFSLEIKTTDNLWSAGFSARVTFIIMRPAAAVVAQITLFVNGQINRKVPKYNLLGSTGQRTVRRWATRQPAVSVSLCLLLCSGRHARIEHGGGIP